VDLHEPIVWGLAHDDEAMRQAACTLLRRLPPDQARTLLSGVLVPDGVALAGACHAVGELEWGAGVPLLLDAAGVSQDTTVLKPACISVGRLAGKLPNTAAAVRFLTNAVRKALTATNGSTVHTIMAGLWAAGQIGGASEPVLQAAADCNAPQVQQYIGTLRHGVG
jgi:hypothetical protein